MEKGWRFFMAIMTPIIHRKKLKERYAAIIVGEESKMKSEEKR